ncbi:MAG: glycosyl hydrolase [Solirubrobacterales bacterium]
MRRTLLLATVVAAQLVLLGGNAQAAPIATGAYIPGAAEDPRLIDSYARKVGREPAIVLSYKNWSSLPFDDVELDSIWRRGGIPMITWEPWTSSHKPFSLRQIAAGRFDVYLRRAAGSAANYGKPFMVRFAQEMNGNWFPWGQDVGGNTPRDFRKAWKHMVDLFRFHGATNVIWVWSPNEDSGGNFQFAPLYPGDEWVDWVALDGFNFGDTEGWPSFTTVFGDTYDRLVRLTSRPVMIAETGSHDVGGDKAAWIASALGREAPRFPKVKALVWFDDQTSRGDFRIDTSVDSLRAFRRGISSPAYAGTRQELLSTPASALGIRPAPAPPEGGFGAPSLWEEIRLRLDGAYLWGAIAAALLVLAAIIVATLLLARRRLRRRSSLPVGP